MNFWCAWEAVPSWASGSLLCELAQGGLDSAAGWWLSLLPFCSTVFSLELLPHTMYPHWGVGVVLWSLWIPRCIRKIQEKAAILKGALLQIHSGTHVIFPSRCNSALRHVSSHLFLLCEDRRWQNDLYRFVSLGFLQLEGDRKVKTGKTICESSLVSSDLTLVDGVHVP